MKRTERRDQIYDHVTVLYEVPGNPTERNWTDKFGEHFEYRWQAPNGLIVGRKVTRTAWGWSPTWDEVRKSVMDAAALARLSNPPTEGEG